MSVSPLNQMKTLISGYQQLAQNINESTQINDFFKQWGDSKDELGEILARIYIDYTCHTNDKEKSELLQSATLLQEEISSISNKISKKVVEHYKQIPPHLEYAFQLLHNALNLFHEQNLTLETQEQVLSQEYQSLIGALSFQYNGEEFPISQSKIFLENQDRTIRQEVFTKTQEAFANIKGKVNDIFNDQVSLRDLQAKNLKYDNYRDYMHIAKDRFDYTTEECLEFSASILKHIVPLASQLREKRKNQLRLESLKPFDVNVDISGKPALKPFSGEKDFVPKTLQVLNAVHPSVAKTLEDINKLNGLDLFSRKGKAPGGYNFPLTQSKTSFIFMNCAFTHTDLTTLVHEVGHAYHFDCYKHNDTNFIYQNPPSEVAELASMSMELMSMEHWNLIYNKEDEKRARLQQLEGIVHFFPWMAVVDSFQQWVYTNPLSTPKDRNEYFKTLYTQFFPTINWEDLEQYLPTNWQKQPHIVEVPFYYIEYGIAQLGALQIWNRYKKDPQQTFKEYTKALSLGSAYPIKEIYHHACVKLDFSDSFILSIANDLKKELDL